MKSTEFSHQQNWSDHYSRTQEYSPVYPTEWVVRVLAGGNYPHLRMDKTSYRNAKILDLSCGDGRNLALLENLGFEVHATEITPAIVERLEASKPIYKWNTRFKCGTNQNLPYENDFFDYLLSCASFYYLNMDSDFNDVLREISRVMKPGGFFIGNIPDRENFIFKDGELMEDGSVVIRKDPYGLRNGTRFMSIADPNDLQSRLTPWFEHFRVGHLQNDFFGLMVSSFVFVCQKRHN